eukprot:7317349-Prymnesium_polylepis.1
MPQHDELSRTVSGDISDRSVKHIEGLEVLPTEPRRTVWRLRGVSDSLEAKAALEHARAAELDADADADDEWDARDAPEEDGDASETAAGATTVTQGGRQRRALSVEEAAEVHSFVRAPLAHAPPPPPTVLQMRREKWARAPGGGGGVGDGSASGAEDAEHLGLCDGTALRERIECLYLPSEPVMGMRSDDKPKSAREQCVDGARWCCGWSSTELRQGDCRLVPIRRRSGMRCHRLCTACLRRKRGMLRRLEPAGRSNIGMPRRVRCQQQLRLGGVCDLQSEVSSLALVAGVRYHSSVTATACGGTPSIRAESAGFVCDDTEPHVLGTPVLMASRSNMTAAAP